MSENQTKACNSNVTCHMACPYVDPWDMVNNFCFHVYAQKSLLIGENGNVFWTTSRAPDKRAIYLGLWRHFSRVLKTI